MILAVVSASAWDASPSLVRAKLSNLQGYHDGHVVLIDQSVAFQQNDAPISGQDKDNTVVVSLGDLLSRARQPDSRKIRNLAKEVPVSEFLVLVASRFDYGLISAVIDHARNAWFVCDEWHVGIAVVVDASIVHPIAKKLSQAFYLQPVELTLEEVDTLVRSLRRDARWYGLTQTFPAAKFLQRATAVIGRWPRALMRRINHG